jgi:hypothetical protein
MEKEFELLHEWLNYYIEEYTNKSRTFHPTQVIRTMKEMGLMFVDKNPHILTFEEYKLIK